MYSNNHIFKLSSKRAFTTLLELNIRNAEFYAKFSKKKKIKVAEYAWGLTLLMSNSVWTSFEKGAIWLHSLKIKAL